MYGPTLMLLGRQVVAGAWTLDGLLDWGLTGFSVGAGGLIPPECRARRVRP